MEFDPGENICKFSGPGEGDGGLFAFRFIYETMPQRLGKGVAFPSFACNLVMNGEARFECGGGKYLLSPGDFFFTFPQTPFTLSECRSFKYLYISFVGNRPADLLRASGITKSAPVKRGFCDAGLRELWVCEFARCDASNLSMLSKGLLYLTLSRFSRNEKMPSGDGKGNGIVGKIKNYVDKCYAESGLSLEEICRVYSFSSNYISRKFKKETGMAFSAYLENCRIRHACVLLRSTAYTVKEIALSVGYSDPLYFSKVFRKNIGQSPSEFRLSDS